MESALRERLARVRLHHQPGHDRRGGDRNAAAAASREIRYWGARRASAEVVKTSDDKSKVSFGLTVTLRRDDGREQSFRIVGEDEADPSRGTLSHLSPLARALLTHGPGEAVAIAGHEAIILDVR